MYTGGGSDRFRVGEEFTFKSQYLLIKLVFYFIKQCVYNDLHIS